ncbi:ATP-binding protein [Spartinivicinus poritis]|uniref:ATP-binding protein n=1 Tax=Spartinivicinus poritis TaxID=2994640 RepID=A0ABT5U7Z8_9GAMM|nr:ATP-binding protein [Spartinivicinus sp. A2-2]MDE1462121.1 ATP-binding protein [Spartinivicinus sp. A2-2]
MDTYDSSSLSPGQSLLTSLQPYFALLNDMGLFVESAQPTGNNSDSVNEQAIQEWFNRRSALLAQPIEHPRLIALKTGFSLSQQELQLIILLLIPQLDPSFRRLYVSLYPDDYSVPSMELLLSLLGLNSEQKQQAVAELLTESPLTRWQIIRLPDQQHQLMGGTVYLASEVVSFLLDYKPENSVETVSTFDGFCDYLLAVTPPSHPLVEPVKSIQTSVKWVQLIGAEGSGRRVLAGQHSPRLFQLDTERFWQLPDPRQGLLDALRNLQLYQADLLWPAGLTQLTKQTGLLELLKDWPGQRVYFSEDIQQPWPINVQHDQCQAITLPGSDSQRAQQLWQAIAKPLNSEQPQINVENISATHNKINWSLVAQRYPLLPGTMLQVVQQSPLPTTEGVLSACLEAMPQQLGGLATRLIPQATRSDLVLTTSVNDQLDELLGRFQHAQSLTKAGLANTPGVIALFWGKPGTGKTLCAEALAGELRLPLFKANLANISSKWIGETEKHLAQLFDEVERVNGILFFDEADAVFAKRSKVESSHDKNANLGVSYLLQRLESFSGLLILATNFKNNLEPAILRRLHASIEFPIPDQSTRLALWQQWADRLTFATDVDMPLLAEQLELSGAQIRNIIQLAYSLTLANAENKSVIKKPELLRAIQREYQKMDNSFLLKQLLLDWR